MAKLDVKIHESAGATTRVFQVAAGAVGTILAGEPVKYTSDGSPYVIKLATGDPETGTDLFVGIAATNSTDKVAVDGEVEVLMPVPGRTLLKCAPTTASNANTQAEINALVGDAVAFDLTDGVFTIDEDEGNDDNVHGLIIEGGSATEGVLYFSVKSSVMKQGSILA